MADDNSLIPRHGGYRKLKSFQVAQLCYATYPALAANAALVLIGVACALLDRQVASQAAAFENEGGFTERLYRIRSQRRQNPPRPSGP